MTIIPSVLNSQVMPNEKEGPGGTVSLGMRTTVSTFNGHHDESNGFGVGGQFRIQFADQVNSDWFFDYIQSSIGDYAQRTDYHIGWSVLFYPWKSKNPQLSFSSKSLYTPTFRPYLLAGHCFDQTFVRSTVGLQRSATRFSSAVQGGLGVHMNVGPRFDVSLTSQYMLHLGKELDAHYHDGAVEFHEEASGAMEGHLLFTLSLNYKIGDLW